MRQMLDKIRQVIYIRNIKTHERRSTKGEWLPCTSGKSILIEVEEYYAETKHVFCHIDKQ